MRNKDRPRQGPGGSCTPRKRRCGFGGDWEEPAPLCLLCCRLQEATQPAARGCGPSCPVATGRQAADHQGSIKGQPGSAAAGAVSFPRGSWSCLTEQLVASTQNLHSGPLQSLSRGSLDNWTRAGQRGSAGGSGPGPLPCSSRATLLPPAPLYSKEPAAGKLRLQGPADGVKSESIWLH